MNNRVKEIIELYDLSKHPEGGYYKEVYRSDDAVEVDGKKKSWVTDIYFLLPKDEFSAAHQIKFDEIWHFYEGAPLELIDLAVEESSLSKIILGNGENNAQYKHCIKGGHWQAAKSLGEYSFLGCTVAPGFDFEDFKMLRNLTDECTKLIKDFPSIEEYL